MKPEDRIRFKLGIPQPPPLLNKGALEAWDRMCVELKYAGLLAGIARDRLARYCTAWADYEEIRLMQNKLGAKRFRITDDNWREQTHWLKVIKESEATMQAFELEYGLTPASAAKVQRPPRQPGKNELPASATPVEAFDAFLEEGRNESK